MATRKKTNTTKAEVNEAKKDREKDTEVKVAAMMSRTGSRRLFRSETDKMVGGVCGGLAEYFDIDAAVVRLIFALTVLFGGSGLLLYLILWLVIPSKSQAGADSARVMNENAEEIKTTTTNSLRQMKGRDGAGNRNLGAYLLIGVGLLFLLSNSGAFGWVNAGELWPLLLVLLGLLMIFRR